MQLNADVRKRAIEHLNNYFNLIRGNPETDEWSDECYAIADTIADLELLNMDSQLVQDENN